MTLARATAARSATPASSQTALEIALETLIYGDFQERWEAVKLFSQLEPEAIDRAIELLDELVDTDEDDGELTWFIARILGQSDRPEAVSKLIQLLAQSQNEEVKTIAATTLANFGERAIEPLRHLLVAEPQWRRLAIQGLSLIQHPTAIEPLLDTFNDPDPQIRAATLSALHAFRDRRVLAVFIAAFNDLSATVRREATIGLGLRATDRADSGSPIEWDLVQQLEQRLYDLDLSVCQQAAIALSRCGTDAAAEALFRVLVATHTPMPLQVEIVRSLSWIDSSLGLEYLRQALDLESPMVCLEAIRAIGQVCDTHYQSIATGILLNWLNSEHRTLQQPEIRQAVALELGRLGNSQALSHLQTLKRDPDAKVRIHAEKAYEMVIGHLGCMGNT